MKKPSKTFLNGVCLRFLLCAQRIHNKLCTIKDAVYGCIISLGMNVLTKLMLEWVNRYLSVIVRKKIIQKPGQNLNAVMTHHHDDTWVELRISCPSGLTVRVYTAAHPKPWWREDLHFLTHKRHNFAVRCVLKHPSLTSQCNSIC